MSSSSVLRRFSTAFAVCAGAIACSLSLSAQAPNTPLPPYSASLLNTAKAGDSWSQTALAVAYLQGRGVQRDLPQAANWFQKAYSQGDRDAAGWLGGMYLAGQGVPLDLVKGAHMIEESRLDGSAVGLRYTALETEQGIGRTADARLALKLYEAAAGHRDAVSCDRMGLAYQVGRYRQKDLNKASSFFFCGVQGGYSWSQLHLGEMYASTLTFHDAQSGREKGSEQWLSEAYAAFTKAADSGNRVGAFRAAQALRDGSGTDISIIAAQARFKEASYQQYGPAQEALADLYHAHPELTQDKRAPYILYKRAAANGQAAAAGKASEARKQLTPKQADDADKALLLLEARGSGA